MITDGKEKRFNARVSFKIANSLKKREERILENLFRIINRRDLTGNIPTNLGRVFVIKERQRAAIVSEHVDNETLVVSCLFHKIVSKE